MKKGTFRKNKLGVIALTLGLCVALTGCGGSNSAAMDSMPYKDAVSESYDGGWGGDYNYEVMEDAAEYEVGTTGGTQDSATVEVEHSMEEKLIRTVDMNVETKEYDKLMDSITAKVKELGGYIENMDTYNGSIYSDYRSGRNANMTLRIPKNHLDTFLEAVSAISNVTRKNEGVENVTLRYVDLESHKKALETEYNRLMELLEKAESIDDIITIESRMSTVRYQMESMESQLRTLDNQVDYSTVYLNVDEVVVYTPVEESTTWERIGDGFMESLRDIGQGVKEIAIYLIIKLPYLVLAGAFMTLFIWWAIHTNNKRNKKAASVKEAQKNNESI